jgi:hypothetical protein
MSLRSRIARPAGLHLVEIKPYRNVAYVSTFKQIQHVLEPSYYRYTIYTA